MRDSDTRPTIHSLRTGALRSALQPAACLLALLALGVGAAALLAPAQSSAQQGGPDPSVIADQLPPLSAAGGQVALPLAGDAPFSWVAIDGGPGVGHPDGHLQTRYTVAGSRPAGAALIFRAGTLAGLDRLEIEIRGNRNTQLVPTLRDTAGVVYRFPAVPVQAGPARTHSLAVSEMQYFPGQATAPDPGSFDPGTAILLSLVDIAGFTGAVPVGTEIEWTVSGLKGVLAGERAEDPGAHPDREPSEPAAAERARNPAAERAEARFFANFNGPHDGTVDRTAALDDLRIAFFSDPDDPRTALWLGLNHLWIAAEGDRTDPAALDSLVLAEHFLARAQELAPGDERIPSWLVPTRQALAQIARDRDRVEALEGDLLAAYARDPEFHSFSVAMLGFREPRGSLRFERGLEALRAPSETCGKDDPTCQNAPRWPHNVEGFVSFAADYELKAGNVERARDLLVELRALPSYASWPYRAETEDRWANLDLYADLFANDDPGDDPTHLVLGSRSSCQACHRAG